jgi:hypothetical protein
MRSLLILCALVACKRDATQAQASWWCWTDSVCFAERSECQDVARVIGTRPTCVARATAFCRRGCSPIEPGVTPVCGAWCAVDRESCEDLHGSTKCLEEAPPKRPELFEYSTPGFWCYDLQGPRGSASWCMKDREECEWMLDDSLAKVGMTRVSAGGAALAGCSRPTMPVNCWSRRVDGKLALVCTLTPEFCEATRAYAETMPVPAGHSVTDISACAPWAYD